MVQARFSVRSAVTAGFDFWRRDGLKAVGPLAIAAVVGLASTAAATGEMRIAALVINLLAVNVAQAALFRLALHPAGAESPDRNGPFGLQWRGLETRLLGLTLVLIILFVGLALLATLALALVMAPILGQAAVNATTPEALLAALPPAARLAFNLSLAVFLVAMILLAIRLTLATPDVAVENRIRLRPAFRMTKGAVGPLFLAQLLIYLPIIALQGLAWAFVQVTGSPELEPWAQAIAGAVGTFFYIPISVGMTAYIYLRLRGGDDK
ncbi:MAG: hypothetical protein Q8L66_16510 [Caulobacter sp.]|nr:hypothetical protein [Caulobacter sp.]